MPLPPIPWQHDEKFSRSGGLSRTRAKEARTAGAYPGFCIMKQLRVLRLHPPPPPPGWDASPSQG